MRFLVDECTGPAVARGILLRLADERPAAKIDVLRRLLSAYADRISGQFVVVTETKIRFALINPVKYT
jgi:hypothetical protein